MIHIWPHALFDILAQVGQHIAGVWPSVAQRDLKQRTDDPPRILRDIRLVRDESKVLHAVPRDVGLKQDIDLSLRGQGVLDFG